MLKDNIVKYRKALNISQSELGQRIGVSRQTIARIEKGENNPSIDTLHNIAEALGVEVQILFREETLDDHQKLTTLLGLLGYSISKSNGIITIQKDSYEKTIAAKDLKKLEGKILNRICSDLEHTFDVCSAILDFMD